MDVQEDKTLCEDLSLFSAEGQGHLPSLISRLDKTLTKLKKLCQTGSLETAACIAVTLVDVYFSCLNCSKLAKQIGKLLSSLPPCLKSPVESQMKVKVQEIIADSSSLNKVSSLLEQSASGRMLLRHHLGDLCQCLHRNINRSMTELFPTVTQSDAADLLMAVKVSLQVVQHFRDDVMKVICQKSDASSSDISENFSHLVQALLMLLSRKGHDTDIYLFGGTILAMLLNFAPDSHMAVESFRMIHTVLVNGNGKCQIGNLCLHVENEVDNYENSIAELTLVRAVIICSQEDILMNTQSEFRRDQAAHGSRGDNPFFLRLFPIVLKFCEDNKSNEYYSFQILSLWFQRLQKCLSQLHSKKTVSLTSKESPYLMDTLKHVFLNWDSPVDGVTDYVGEIFQCLLVVWSRERADRCTDNVWLAEKLLQQLLDLPWNVKGKYKLIGLLLPYADVTEVLQTSCLQQHLLRCMGTNNLAPIASDVYKICLQQTENVSDYERLTQWKESWLEILLAGLSSDEILLCKKLSDYWIPLTLKVLPVSVTFLPRYLCDLLEESGCLARSHKLLYVWLLVVRIIRSNRGMDEKDFNLPLLTEGLYSEDEDTRGEVVAFLCGSLKKSELLCETECQLLKSCLPLCLRVDSAPFRQHLAANMKKLMVRLRDGCWAAIKKKQQTLLETSLKFLDWLQRMLIHSLFPGASYQRRKTGLEILNVMYETLVYVPGGVTQQRGQAGEQCTQVLEYAHSQGLCYFFTHESTVAVVNCVLDGADEVQEMSSQLLMRFFPWSVPNPPYNVLDLACHLLNISLQLCSSPRPYESRSGALLCHLLYIKYACEQGVVFQKQTGHTGYTSEQTEEASGCRFIGLLVQEIQQSISLSEEDPVKASKESPLHGLIQAVTLCLRSRSFCGANDELLTKLLKVNMKVIQMMMAVMSGGSNKENCPSFAEMGMALETLVSEGEGESLSLTPDFQLMLSWCWVNLKESCTCLGEVTSALIKSSTDHEAWQQDIGDVGQVFIQVLTNCRVRGAIEGCRNGLLKYSTVLLSSDNKSFSSVPADILKQILKSLESNVMSASVTRRSAGLPIIVQVIAQAEHKLKQNQLLSTTVDTLFCLAALPFCTDTDQKQDLVQVHALNILKAVFGDASLVVTLMSRYTSVLLIIFDGFESPSWAIRNAATQLFGTIVGRMFGPRSKGGSGQNIMTLPELSAHYPGLPSAMLERLTTGVTDIHNIDSLRPSLFLVLTLLANLGPVDTQQNGHRSDADFKQTISACLETPVYTLRELSAQAYVAFVPFDTGEQELIQLTDSLPASPLDIIIHNRLHGTLLCVEKLIINREFSVKVKQKVVTIFLRKSWILTELGHCPLLGAKYVQIIRHLIHGLTLADNEMHNIVVLLKSCGMSGRSDILQIGTGLTVRDSVECLTDLLKDRQIELTNLFCEWLHSDSSDICLSSLNVLSDKVKNKQVCALNWIQIQNELCSLVIRSPDARVQTATMHLLCYIRLCQLSDIISQIHFTFEDLQTLTSQSDSKSRLHAACIPVRAILVEISLKNDVILDSTLVSDISAWSELVQESSDPMQSEDLRTAAVTALLIAGTTTFSVYSKQSQCSLPENTLIFLIESVFQLLEDGDTEIRKMAARFVSSLHWEQRQVQFEDLNSTTCQQLFSQYIGDNLSWSVTVSQYLLEKIYKPGEATAACQSNRISSRCSVLFEQEDSSVLSERPLQQLLLHATLKNCLTKGTVLPGSYLKIMAGETLGDLNTCTPVLERHLQDSPLINITSDASVLSALTGIILVADIFMTVVTNVDDVLLQGLRKGLQTLKKMKVLHPWLHSRLDECLSVRTS